MAAAELLTRLAGAEQALSCLEDELVRSPGVVPRSVERLEGAVALLASGPADLAGTAEPEQLRRRLHRVRRQVRRVRALLGAAAEFHAGWAQIVASVTEGYGRTGEVIPLRATARVVVEG